MIECKVCLKPMQRISPAHLSAFHQMTVAEYQAMFPDAPIVSPELSAKLSAKQKAVQGTPEARAKMSAATKGIPKTADHNAKNSAAQKGKVIPADVRAKMSTAAKVRVEREGPPHTRPGTLDGLHRVMATDEYKEAHAKGQATTYETTRFNGLNDRVAALFLALDLVPEREMVLGPYRYDFAFPLAKVALEVMGCRWHFCPQHTAMHGGLTEADRIKRQRIDKAKRTFVANRGWTVIDVWEHDLPKDDAKAASALLDKLPAAAWECV